MILPFSLFYIMQAEYCFLFVQIRNMKKSLRAIFWNFTDQTTYQKLEEAENFYSSNISLLLNRVEVSALKTLDMNKIS